MKKEEMMDIIEPVLFVGLVIGIVIVAIGIIRGVMIVWKINNGTYKGYMKKGDKK